VIEHTHKLPQFRKLRAPPSLAGTVLRGELYGEREGKAIPAEQTGGLLNATVWRSRERQEQLGAELKPIIFDVVKYQGRDMENAPYAEKLKVLEEVARKVPRLKLPPTAKTPEEKIRLFSRIQAGEEPITSEGIISWKLDKPGPTKAKFRPDVDAEVVGVTSGKGRHKDRIGALKVRLPGKQAVTHVGTGFSDRLREEIARDPEKFIGRVAKVRTMQVFPSGKLRAPSFAGFHLEKGRQDNGS
jgi:ATP-dependent DNA ligase